MAFIYVEKILTSPHKVEVLEDITCDSCYKTTRDKLDFNFEYASLSAHWGYGSSMDDDRWEYHLCEGCAVRAYDFLGLSPVKPDS